MRARHGELRSQRFFSSQRMRGDAFFWGSAVLSLLLAGCASSPPRSLSSGVAVNAQSGCHAPEPNLRAAYNRPYSVKGRTYTPLRSAQGYDEVGTASWYGWESGSTTSMGTRFNPRDFSAASRVLPLPTCVQVTNLDNGLSALVLVNDRGPFVSSRILDLSMGAAAALGVTRTGTAQVRIVALPEGANAPLQMASQTNNALPDNGPSVALPTRPEARSQDASAPEQFAPQQPVAIASSEAATEPAAIVVQALPPLTRPAPPQVSASTPASRIGTASGLPPLPQPALTLPSDSAVVGQPATPEPQTPMLSSAPQTYLQTGAFTLEANAQAEQGRLQAAGIAGVVIIPGYIRGQMFYRVQVGPLNGAPDAALVQKLQGLGLSQYSVVQQ